ncbi:MAG: UDP-glucose/GDP-mannose dehydrogenase family protein [Actinomycetota bacterium]
MKIAVVGVGHVGLVTAATLAKMGHEVVGLDDDDRKIEGLNQGKLPFFEPGLKELIEEVTAAGRLRFSQDPADAIAGATVAFSCVGTPSRADGEANLLAVEKAAESVGKHATGDIVFVQKSTVPIHTADRVQAMLRRISKHRFYLVSNPEFLKEGSAVEDSLHPDRLLVGADMPEAHEIMRSVYEPLMNQNVTYFATDIKTAELAKHACNAFLALKISFANALAQICDASGADVCSVADIMGSDPRIGRAFLNAGLGYGGYCFPKDVAAFKVQAARFGYEFDLLDDVIKINQQALQSAFRKVNDVLWNIEGKRIVLLGLAFKALTDDVRESPSLYLAKLLIDAGAEVIGYDPQANQAARAQLPELQVVDDLYEAAEGAHCLVIATEWPEFADLDLSRLKGIMTHPIIVDARNILDPQLVAEAGFTYLPTGRPPVNL